MERRKAPGTEEGWYVLHDLRHVDWDGWREAPETVRERAVEEGTDYLRCHEALADAEEGASAVFSVVGHDADLLVLHLRPTLEHLDRAQRRLESTALAAFTERADSYVSVTEVSGYMHEDLTDGLDDIDDEGTRSYMRQRIYPEIPDAGHVCFYPMDKRRGPEDNWYDLPFDERAEYMSAHGEVGREYAGRVTQIIAGSVGLDDHEWGVTLFADDPTDIKELLYEMRFDPSSSRFAEFGDFYVGRRFPPDDLGALLAGEAVPTDEPLDGTTTDDTTGTDDGEATGDADDGDDGGSGGRPSTESAHEPVDAGTFLARADAHGADLDVEAAGYGLLFESEAPAATVAEEVEGLRANFDHYDTHVGTEVLDGERTVVVSLWANQRAADTASGFLADLPGVDGGVGADLEGHGTDDAAAGTDDGGDPAEHGADNAGEEPRCGEPPHESVEATEFRRLAHRFGVDPGDHPAAGYALLFRSETAAEHLVEEVDDLRERFESHEGHVLTTVRADSGDTAVVSLWADGSAADTGSESLTELSGVGAGVGAAFESEGAGADTERDDDDIRGELADLGVYAGQPHGEGVYALVLYSEAPVEELHEELAGLRDSFEGYESHVKSAVYDDEAGEGRPAVVSIWETQDAADRAAEFLADLPGVVGRTDEAEGDFGTMGMFYTVKPDYRGEFVDTFAEVGEVLGGMDGHLDTRLMVNREDEDDMFIASRWRQREDAMAFFRSESFRDTVEWGREVLDDRPRHVFLA